MMETEEIRKQRRMKFLQKMEAKNKQTQNKYSRSSNSLMNKNIQALNKFNTREEIILLLAKDLIDNNDTVGNLSKKYCIYFSSVSKTKPAGLCILLPLFTYKLYY